MFLTNPTFKMGFQFRLGEIMTPRYFLLYKERIGDHSLHWSESQFSRVEAIYNLVIILARTTSSPRLLVLLNECCIKPLET